MMAAWTAALLLCTLAVTAQALSKALKIDAQGSLMDTPLQKEIHSDKTANNEELQRIFETIARSGHDYWQSTETISGKGSDMAETVTVRTELGRWINKYNVSFLMDIPCGDANWQGSIPGIDAIKYQGYDIALTAVEAARSKNVKHKSMQFDHLDLTSAVPPGKPDLIMLRDVIMHLPLKLGRDMLINAKKSGAKWLAVSSFTGSGRNRNFEAGVAAYQNDVHKAPFNLPEAEEECQNYDIEGVEHQPYRLELIELSKWDPSSTDKSP